MMNLLNKITNGVNKIVRGKTSAIILCAGSSTRFSQGNDSKQMALVLGKPVILHTLKSFEEAECVDEIILVVRKEDIDSYNKLVKDYSIKKVKGVVAGGSTRQESASLGFNTVSRESKYVAIHDGARCLVTPDIINCVATAAYRFKAAAAASKTTDTVKMVDKKGFVIKTIDRDFVWNVQTPQMFEKKLYNVSLNYTKANKINVTDDCMMAESAGFKVKLIDTGKENIKITYKSDIMLAEQIIGSRREDK